MKYNVGFELTKEELDEVIRKGFKMYGCPKEVRDIIRYGMTDLVIVTFEGEKIIEDGGEFYILNMNNIAEMIVNLHKENDRSDINEE